MSSGGPFGVKLTTVDTVQKFGLLDTYWAKNGLYVYAQANGAITAGMACKIDETGQADTVTTAESGSTPKVIGIAKATLADNEYGWFWRGCGVEEAYVLASTGDDTALTTHTATGVLSTGGDAIVGGLVTTAARGGTDGLVAVQAYGLLGTN